MLVPWDQVNQETLTSLLEEFVTRDGTDYGEREISVASRVAQAMNRLKGGEVVIWFDAVTESVTLMTKDDANNAAELSSQPDASS
tara:strand:+ start:154724 stop:154978 length:255 start_codon:yes stop_codon:yes gene_type:complete